MSVRLVIGRAGVGKTEQILTEMHGRMADAPLGSPLVLLVPEQATFQAEQALVARSKQGGLLRAQALSFRRLAYRILQETGGYARVPIEDSGQRLQLFALLEQHKETLTRYRASANKPGFLDKLHELFQEWKRYGLDADTLAQELHKLKSSSTSSQELLGKLHELLPLYRDYEQTLAASYIDSEDILNLLAAQAEQSAWLRSAEIWIDGFNGFTPLEYHVLGTLIRVAKSVTMTLKLDRPYYPEERPSELDLFHPTAVTCSKMMALCAEYQVKVEIEQLQTKQPPRFSQAEPLAIIERRYHYRRPWDQPVALDAHLQIHAAPNRRTEVEHIASQMVALVRDGGYRWRDLAVLMRKPDGYVDLIQQIFDDFQIPYFLDAKKGVMEQPLIEFIRSGLEIVTKGWTYDAVFRCLKTDLLTPVLTDQGRTEARKLVDELENYVLAFGIQGSTWTNDRPWSYRVLRSIEDDDPGANEIELAKLARMNDLRARIVAPFKKLDEQLKQSKQVRSIAQAIYEWLEDVQVPTQLAEWSASLADAGELRKAKEMTRLWAEVIEWFDQLVEVLGDQDVELAELDRLLEAGLEGMKLGTVPPSLDQVVIGSLERTRFGGIKQAFVVGVNDGVFPSKFNEDSLLSELERGMLAEQGMELAPDARRKLLDEQFMIYNALTVASDKLWLSYALQNEEGASMLPSEIVRRLQMLFPALEVKSLAAEPTAQDALDMQLQYMARPSQALSHLILQLRAWRNGQAIHPIWWQTYQELATHGEWQFGLRRLLAHLFYANTAEPLSKETTRLLYGDTLTTSVSKMEMFNACPFQYFSANGLKLRERHIYKLDTPDIGQLFHAALSHIGKTLLQQGRSWGSLSSVECRQFAEQAIELFGPRLQSEILLSSSRYAYIASKFKDVVARTVDVLSEHGRRGMFTPVGLELAFGRGGEMPGLPLTLDQGAKMEIIGRIDRVDQAEHNGELLLRLVDYKSSRQELKMDKLYYGLSLQLLTYLDVAVANAEHWLGRKAQPAGMMYMHVHNPLTTTKNNFADEQLLKNQFKAFQMKGYVLDNIDVAKLMDIQMAPQYKSDIISAELKKDGTWGSRAKVMSPDQMETARQFVRHKIREVGSNIMAGQVAIEPYEMKAQKPCTFCSFKPVCQFEPTAAESNVRHLQTMKDEQTWAQIQEALGKGGRA